MQVTLILLRQLIMFYIMIVMGFILVKARILEAKDSKVLSSVLIYLVLPCVIIHAFQIELTDDTLQGILFAFAAAILVHAVFLVLITIGGKILGWNSIDKATVMYSNAGNMIIPIVTAVLGKEWVLYSSAYISIQIILLWTHCSSMLCKGQGFQWKKVLKNVNMIAILIGMLLFFTRIELPTVIDDTMTSVGALLAPMGMFITGMLIAEIDFKKALKNRRIYGVCAARLIICPLVILGIFYITRMADMVPDGRRILLITFLATMTPASSTITQMAQIYDQDADYASILNFCSTLFCVITMTVLTAGYCWIYQI